MLTLAATTTHSPDGLRSGGARDQGRKTLVVGLGKTGLSCARYLRGLGHAVAITDSRANPPGLAAVRAEMPDTALFVGGFAPEAFAAAERIVLSPGVSKELPLIASAIARGVAVVGDIELFAAAARAPIVAITGSNGKSTVTTLLGRIAQLAGLRVGVGGNLGEPALDLLADDIELYVIELSSFQLETTASLRCRAATVLNVSPDHLDRYPNLDAYVAAKARIFSDTEVAVVNLDDPIAARLAAGVDRRIGFSLTPPRSPNDLGIVVKEGVGWLMHGDKPLMRAGEITLSGRHNLANALAAAALAIACDLPAAAMIEAMRTFGGLPHRTQLIAERGGVRWYDDSKGTNPGATIAALEGLIEAEGSARAVLIAGGDSKGADFVPLVDAVSHRARAVVLIGRDAPAIERVLATRVPLAHANDMDEAVQRASEFARPGDCVLLSPACASFDMFDNYEHRGRAFAEAVERLG